MSGPWPGRPEVLVPGGTGFFRFLWLLSRALRGADAVILRGTSGLQERYVELAALLLVKLRPGRRPRTVVGDATWDVTSRRLEEHFPRLAAVLPRFARLAVRAVDGPHVVYGVLSTEELRDFPERWGVDPSRVRMVPFCATMAPALREEASEGDYVLACGNSYRDYDLMVAAAEGLQVQVRIASSWEPARPLPPNVTVSWLPPGDYERALLGARVVVVPLRGAARSAGQQTYLNAMMLGKPLVVTNSPGVSDYLTDHETGLVVPSRPEALRQAIEWVLAGENRQALAEMTRRARTLVEERFLMRHYFARLWELATSER